MTVTDSMASGLSPVVPKQLPAGLSSELVLFDRANSADPGSAAAVDEIRIYYAKSAIDDAATIVDVYASGGGVLIERSAAGQDAEFVVSVVGKENASIIKIGQLDAALIHSSPWPGGFRTWAVFFSDGSRDYSLILNVDADEVVRTAQSMFC